MRQQVGASGGMNVHGALCRRRCCRCRQLLPASPVPADLAGIAPFLPCKARTGSSPLQRARSKGAMNESSLASPAQLLQLLQQQGAAEQGADDPQLQASAVPQHRAVWGLSRRCPGGCASWVCCQLTVSAGRRPAGAAGGRSSPAGGCGAAADRRPRGGVSRARVRSRAATCLGAAQGNLGCDTHCTLAPSPRAFHLTCAAALLPARFVIKTANEQGQKVFINVCGTAKLPLPSGWTKGQVPSEVRRRGRACARLGRRGGCGWQALWRVEFLCCLNSLLL